MLNLGMETHPTSYDHDRFAIDRRFQMSSKFSFQSGQDFHPGTSELHARESSSLMRARHEMEMRLASLREAQRDLLQQLKADQLAAHEHSADEQPYRKCFS